MRSSLNGSSRFVPKIRFMKPPRLHEQARCRLGRSGRVPRDLADTDDRGHGAPFGQRSPRSLGRRSPAFSDLFGLGDAETGRFSRRGVGMKCLPPQSDDATILPRGSCAFAAESRERPLGARSRTGTERSPVRSAGSGERSMVRCAPSIWPSPVVSNRIEVVGRKPGRNALAGHHRRRRRRSSVISSTRSPRCSIAWQFGQTGRRSRTGSTA